MKCKTCGGTEFGREYHTASSDLACIRCGTVIEENPIVSEVTFAETASGAATVQGAFVGSDQARANFGNNRGSLDSREQTLANGKRRIREVAAALRIPENISEDANGYFRLALTNNFVQGRRSQTVVAACLYVACRKKETHHMLIDFSSRLQVSVYAVGATFLKLVKTLNLTKIPVIDPSIFIQHFAEKLDFGAGQMKVIRDATKLAKRMSNDWINQGRRPAGIAGACVLLAARMNNFRRTHSEIVAVTHVSETTIQQRLNEFKFTHASNLTVKEFREKLTKKPDEEGYAESYSSIRKTLPPSFMKGRIHEELLREQLHHLEESSDEALSKDPILATFLSDSKLSEKEIQDSIKRALERKTKDGKRLLNSYIDTDGTTKVSNADEVIPFDSPLQPSDVNTMARGKYHLLAQKRYEMEKLQEEEDAITELIEKNRPRNLAANLPKTEDLLMKVADDPVNLDDIDDDEIDNFLLTPEESKIKERIWTGSNQEFLLQLENKRLKEEADKIAGHNQHPKKRRKKEEDLSEAERLAEGSSSAGDREYNEYLGRNKAHMGLFSTVNRLTVGKNASAVDSVRNVLNKKSLSNKINYDAVNSLFNSQR